MTCMRETELNRNRSSAGSCRELRISDASMWRILTGQYNSTYVYLDGKSTDNKTHSIQLYSDITAEWSGPTTTAIQWNSSQTGNARYHQVSSRNPAPAFVGDVAEDVNPTPTSVISTDAQALRSQFAAKTESVYFPPDMDTPVGSVQASGKFPVFAHALDLGSTDTITSIAWAVGGVKDPVISFMNSPRRPYYRSQYPDVGTAVAMRLQTRSRAIALDQQITQAASAISPDYVDLVSLATRQTMASLEITLPTPADGSWDMSDVKAFMKDMGNTQRVNPTETIYAAMPALMYLNSSLIGALLEPLLEYQSSSKYKNGFAASDLGQPYPAAPGNPSTIATYGVEDSGNMLILVLAHARSSGDGSLIAKYYRLLKGWADYLSTNVLILDQQ
ncbi:hypothetical protein C8R46DRAFT_1263050 [Mycena filopes]|nr:hypothetical protein C8R46DRAFT_1263050 [Mycena filopes]